ncbi:conserved hypothetical protein [Flavobacterium psychrophilum]|uniref:Uncharacterized protein n=1 Tax=Flavobacterium psychrophilum TaxID=96345 RepID=A0A7U2NDJ6_FLAPS|nr:hypothetical protein [Flavobacterium psychrophilum]OAE93591.1 hypothetical protein SU65_04235 [Flavobacterium psychrophilum]QRE03013.1 hypothetical protein H0H26_08835 [Flavobacterium psychrophilum]SNB27531.1 conserved hypothetical protein [Flavobacterium psychrophilum]
MKKKLEAELISIAHKILKLKNKEDVRELHHQTQRLYEKLSVLLFVEENFGDIKPTISLYDIENKLEKAFDFDEKIIVAEIKEEELLVKINDEPTIVHIINEEILPVEAIAEEIIVVVEEPEIATEEWPIIEISKPEKKQVSIDDFLSNMQPEPVFERVSNIKKTEDSAIAVEILEDKIEKETFSDKVDLKPVTNLNDKLNKSINIGLNDKLAFEKQLFDGSTEDFNRVVSQISTFDSLEDAKNFIEEMVKPDYNDWKGKEEFANRFMEFVASKFV